MTSAWAEGGVGRVLCAFKQLLLQRGPRYFVFEPVVSTFLIVVVSVLDPFCERLSVGRVAESTALAGFGSIVALFVR